MLQIEAARPTVASGGPGLEKCVVTPLIDPPPELVNGFRRPVFEAVPAALKARPAWVAWVAVPRDNGKISKVPWSFRDRNASSTAQATWGTFDQTAGFYRRHAGQTRKVNGVPGTLAGVGFVLSADDGLVGLDLDHCLDPEKGRLEPWAEAVLAAVAGYAEVSPSGRGLRIIARGQAPDGAAYKPTGAGVEIYDRGRFLTITGHCLPCRGEIDDACQDEAVARVKAMTEARLGRMKREPVSLVTPPMVCNFLDDDQALIEKAKAAANGANFSALWAGDTSGHGDDHSAADLALCAMLAFWTRRDAERMDRLFRRSSLMRPKWDERHHGDGRTYGAITIAKAVAKCRGSYDKQHAQTHRESVQAAEISEPLPDLPPLPLDSFPEACQELITAAAEAFSVPLEVPASSLLALTAACVGRSRGLTIKATWREHGNLYIALVGRSGSGKSPCAGYFFKAIFRAEKEWNDQFRRDLERWEDEHERWKEAKRKARGGEGEDPGPKPEPPKCRQAYVDDTTLEALTDALAASPRGILWRRDELAGLLLDLDKYAGKDGSTKTRLMTAYDAGPWKLSRVLKGTSYIPHACVSIFGTIQPDALPSIFCGKDAATGFLARFLFIFARQDKPALWSEAVMNENHDTFLDAMTAGLLALDLQDGAPVFIEVAQDAKAAFIDWHDRLAMEAWLGADGDEDSLLAKLRGQALRLALLLHLLRAVVEGRDERQAVDAGTMGKALALADWLLAHQRRAWKVIAGAGKACEIRPLEERVAAAIVALESEIRAGMLPTARVTEVVNADLDERYQVSTKAVGKAGGRLGLHSRHLPDKSARGLVIPAERMESLHLIAKNVRNVLNVPNQALGRTLKPDV